MPDQEQDRFWFGKNWSRFLRVLSEDRINAAQQSLATMLERESLQGRSFLDAGSGSGLFSLAALRLGAARVVSIDYDADSVACARELERRFGPYSNWTIAQGSILDGAGLEQYGQFDVVYCWGVMHHTGDMWHAADNIAARVSPGGQLYIAIYNDQGWISRLWTGIKRTYVRSPRLLRGVLVLGYCAVGGVWKVVQGIRRRQPIREWFSDPRGRGMNFYYDVIDWLGGYPFETATAEVVIAFCRERGFELSKLVTTNGSGCNEFVFKKS